MAAETPTVLSGMNLADRLPRERIALLKRLGELAELCGETAYLVGGPVRDLLLNRSHADWDIVVVGAEPERGEWAGIAFAEDAAPAFGGTVVKTHPDFGTATLELPRYGKFDVVTARSETYAHPAALPEARPASLYDDLKRRDFALNGLAMSLQPESGGRPEKWMGWFGDVVDFFGGAADIREKRIRILHPGSFADDPTRVFRAVRFAERFGFRLEEDTRDALAACVRDGWLRALTGARVRNEILLLMAEPRPTDCLKRLDEFGVYEALGNGLGFDAVAEERLKEAEAFPFAPQDEGLLLVWLGCHERRIAESVADVWMLGKEMAAALTLLFERREGISGALARGISPSEWHRLLRDLPTQTVYALAAELPANARPTLFRRWDEMKSARPLVTGDDLKAMGFTPGPAFRQVLEAVFAAQLDGKFADIEEAQRFAAERMRKWN